METNTLSLVSTKLLKEAIDKNVKLLAEKTGEDSKEIRSYIFEEADPHNIKLPGDVYLEAYNISASLVKESE